MDPTEAPQRGKLVQLAAVQPGAAQNHGFTAPGDSGRHHFGNHLRNGFLRHADQNKIAGFEFRVILNRMAGLQHIGNAAGYAIRGRFHGTEAL